MAKGFSLCKGCESEIKTSDAKVYSGKKYCEKCYSLKIQTKKEYDELLSTILNYLNLDAPTGLILKQIKEYKEQFNYTYSGITYTMWYCKEIKNMKFEMKYGIGIVKFEYENAKNYFLQQQKVTESVNKVVHVEKIKEIKIHKRLQEKKQLLINIDDLLKDGDSY